MSIGDINSAARGTGARFNDGKVAYDLLPLRVVLDIIKWDGRAHNDGWLVKMVSHLADWQAGDDAALDRAIEAIMPWPSPWLDTFADAARVFDYGRKKYAAWNWAKGMPWSIPLGCVIRHALKELDGQELDEESGLPHYGHIQCNLLMLKQYALTYREGDDRPVQWLGMTASEALDRVSMAPPDSLPPNLAAAILRDAGIGDVPRHPVAAEADRIAEDRL